MPDTAPPTMAAAAAVVTTPSATTADTTMDADTNPDDAVATTTNNTNNNNNNNKNNGAPTTQPPAKPREYNPRWKGYVYIGIASLINFCSISNIPREYKRAYWVSSMCFGVVTFGLALLVLLQDRSQKCLSPFYYTKAKDGYFEGYTLALSVVWWIIGCV